MCDKEVAPVYDLIACSPICCSIVVLYQQVLTWTCSWWFYSVSWFRWYKQQMESRVYQIILCHRKVSDYECVTHVWQTCTLGTSYNENKAIYLARLSSFAYCSSSEIVEWSCSQCRLVEPLESVCVVQDDGDFQGFVGYSRPNNAVIVVFRGSLNLQNWIDNFKINKINPFVQYPHVAVHEGFYRVFESVSSGIVSQVRRLLELFPSANVTITGHSLGGAVASLCGLYFSIVEHIPVYDLYTFGKPRVGDKNYTELIQTAIPHIYRITHYYDPVPHVPQIRQGFAHAPQEVQFDPLFRIISEFPFVDILW